jgi:hypothetical protein
MTPQTNQPEDVQMSELKKCPFCGSDARFSGDWEYERNGFVQCSKCSCSVGECYSGWDSEPDHDFKTKEDAAQAWNTRPADPLPETETGALVKLHGLPDQLNPDCPLKASIEGSNLVIRIGISTLAFADMEAQKNAPENFGKTKLSKITNEGGFAKDVIHELLSENEIGESMLTDLLDKATSEARNNGSMHVEDYE